MYKEFHGEVQQGKPVDMTLREYFPNFNYKGTFLDVGAYEPINISNSYHFEKNGWDVHCFEANTLLIDELKKYRKNVYNYAIYDIDKDDVEFTAVKAGYGGGSGMGGISAVELSEDYLKTFGSSAERIKMNVEQKTLNTVLKNIINDETEDIDIVSIDVEGGELKALKGIDFNKYKIKLMVIENAFNNKEIYEYLKQFNYVLDKRIEYNEYYKLENWNIGTNIE